MDTNGGRASPLPGPDLIAAIEAALADYPDARFEGNELGNLVATDVDGAAVGWIDVRSLDADPPADRWNPWAG